MSFADYLAGIDWNAERLSLYSQSPAEVERALSGIGEPLARFKALLSPAADGYLEALAQRSRTLTLQRFGRVQQLFAPLYLSNACANECHYCGFSMSNPMRRKVLNSDELRIEAQALRDRGFQHLLLVAGEAPKVAGFDYYRQALSVLRSDFSQLSLEVQPLARVEYQRLREVGLHAVLVYQETYDARCYQSLHSRGQKRDFAGRLDALDRAGAAGVHKLGLGVLLGLTDWRLDSLKCAHHLTWLARRHWRSRFSLSFPRLRPAEGGFVAPLPVSDRQLVQLLCAWRLFAPDLELTLSTREAPALRDRLIPLGVTSLSAASSTRPGGYAVEPGKALEQFSTDDQRPVAEVVQSLRNQHYQPVWSDWHPRLG